MTPLLVAALGFLSMGSAFATDTYLPALPDIALDLRTSPALVQATLTVFVIAQAAGNLVIGPVSDRFGRWRPLLISTIVFVLASVGAALAQDIWMLIAMRAVQGLASAAGPVIARAVVADLTHGVQAARLFGILMMVFGIAPVIAPVIGGPLAELGGWRLAMGAIVALGVVGVLVALRLPESLPRDRRRAVRLRSVFGDYTGLVRNRTFFAGSLVVMAAFGIIMTWLSNSSFVLQEHYGLSPTGYAVTFAANSAGFGLAAMLNSALLRRFPPAAILRGTIFVSVAVTAAALVLALVDALPLWTLLVLVTIAFGSTAPIMSNATAVALAAVRPTEVGTASAFLGALEFLLPAIVAPMLGLFGSSPEPTAIGFFAYALLGLALWARLRALPIRAQVSRGA
ncbi:multidrug effflux MFS transporter [Leucobacter soli]|uniref:Bicyclomycin resistance protein n=1 Tax=Leucobacter soli TaxID=2812850 RepID=A0A916NF64_9MICO|nr:multidrug effflux MFS transporter [Leucobacter soli]CAG7600296.1 Bicyclomycin resistance protein [Leucobacter soli]